MSILGSSVTLNTNSLCDPGEITSPLWAPVPLSTKGQRLVGRVGYQREMALAAISVSDPLRACSKATSSNEPFRPFHSKPTSHRY